MWSDGCVLWHSTDHILFKVTIYSRFVYLGDSAVLSNTTYKKFLKYFVMKLKFSIKLNWKTFTVLKYLFCLWENENNSSTCSTAKIKERNVYEHSSINSYSCYR